MTKREKQRVKAILKRLKNHGFNDYEIAVITCHFSNKEINDLLKRLKQYGLKG